MIFQYVRPSLHGLTCTTVRLPAPHPHVLLLLLPPVPGALVHSTPLSLHIKSPSFSRKPFSHAVNLAQSIGRSDSSTPTLCAPRRSCPCTWVPPGAAFSPAVVAVCSLLPWCWSSLSCFEASGGRSARISANCWSILKSTSGGAAEGGVNCRLLTTLSQKLHAKVSIHSHTCVCIVIICTLYTGCTHSWSKSTERRG